MPAGFDLILQQNLRHFQYVLPEMMVIATFILALIFDFAVPHHRRRSTAYICIIGLLVAFWLNVQQNQEFVDHLKNVSGEGALQAMKPISAFSGMIVYDHFGTLFKFIILLGTIASLLLAIHARELFGKNHGEFYLLLVAVCLGGMFLATSTNLLMIYLSLETLSIVSYAMAGFLRRDRKSAEAGIKYVIYGAMASGIMIFGMSYLYGITGTLNLFGPNGIAAQVAGAGGFEETFQHGSRGALVAVLAMVFAGFLYKIAAVPFHYWSPDVYEGAPTTATGFFSVVPKAAGFAVLIRALCAFFPAAGSQDRWLGVPTIEQIIGIVAIATMTIGNLAALGQTNAKRMLAYSSIAHAGYMLAGLSVLDVGKGAADGPSSVVFYLVVYLFMNLGAFVVLVALENIFGGTDLRQLKGAAQREPVLCAALCAFLFSLTGLPPFGGFMGKYLIMWKLADRGHYAMIMFIGINSVVSLYYYMKLAKAVAIDKPEEEVTTTESTPFSYRALALCNCGALLMLFFYFEPIQRLCRQALEPLRF